MRSQTVLGRWEPRMARIASNTRREGCEDKAGVACRSASSRSQWREEEGIMSMLPVCWAGPVFTHDH
eukprot:730205-Hanusia_phi.AAC.1